MNIIASVYILRAAAAMLLLLVIGPLVALAAQPVPPILAFPLFVPFFSLITILIDVMAWKSVLRNVMQFPNAIFALAAFSCLAPRFRTLQCSAVVCLSPGRL